MRVRFQTNLLIKSSVKTKSEETAMLIQIENIKHMEATEKYIRKEDIKKNSN